MYSNNVFFRLINYLFSCHYITALSTRTISLKSEMLINSPNPKIIFLSFQTSQTPDTKDLEFSK